MFQSYLPWIILVKRTVQICTSNLIACQTEMLGVVCKNAIKTKIRLIAHILNVMHVCERVFSEVKLCVWHSGYHLITSHMLSATKNRSFSAS